MRSGSPHRDFCQLCNIGYELRRELNWDQEKVFLNDDEANKLTDRKAAKSGTGFNRNLLQIVPRTRILRLPTR